MNDSQDYLAVYLTSFLLLSIISPAHGILVLAFLFYIVYVVIRIGRV